MYYVVALGNPGEQYEKNRHNVGFVALDFIFEKLSLPTPTKSSQYAGSFLKTTIEREDVIMLYPETFMNHSGSAVKKLIPKEEISNLIVLYDDVALPLGEIRISFDRGDGGHNGIKSIISSLNSLEFIRIRIGIAPTTFWTGKVKNLSGEALPKFVLGNFTSRELETLKADVFPVVKEALLEIIKVGYAKAMNIFN